MVQRWYFQSIRQLPRGAATRHPGRFKDPSHHLRRSTVFFLSLFLKMQKCTIIFKDGGSRFRAISFSHKKIRQGSRNHGEWQRRSVIGTHLRCAYSPQNGRSASVDIPARYRRAVTSHRGITSHVTRINQKNADLLRLLSPFECTPEIFSSVIDRTNAMDNSIENQNWKKVVGCNIVSVEVECVYSSLVRDRYSNR